MKKVNILDLTVTEISSVDRPAVAGATVAIMKSDTVSIRKNAAEVASGDAEPLYKAVEYGDAIMARAAEIGAENGTSAAKALLDHSGTDPVLIALSHGERAAEMAIMKSRSDRLLGT